MHHSVNFDEIRKQRDELFHDYWNKEAGNFEDSPLLEAFREIAKTSFEKGCFHGINIGVEHGAKLSAAAIQSDIEDIVEEW